MAKGEPQRDIWFWFTIAAFSIAAIVLAIASTFGLSIWVSVASVIFVVVVLIGFSARVYLKNRGLIWTEEDKRRLKERQRRQLKSSTVLMLGLLLLLATNWLVQHNILPAPVGFISLIAWIICLIWANRLAKA